MVISRIIAPTVNSKLASVNVNGGSCVFYSSTIWYSITVVLFSWLCSSFAMIIGFPVALASAHAIALGKRQPTVACVRGSFLVSWQTPLSMLLTIWRIIVLFWVWISTFSAKPMVSMRSLGSFSCMYVRSVFVKDMPSSCSKILDKAKPGGVRNMPFWFLEVSFSSVVFSRLGRGWFGFSGTNMRLDSMCMRFLGGKYTPFWAALCSDSILSMLLVFDRAEAFSRVKGTCLVGVM
ncbi:hypothetical protein ES703_113504 [subsurface metagenome]